MRRTSFIAALAGLLLAGSASAQVGGGSSSSGGAGSSSTTASPGSAGGVPSGATSSPAAASPGSGINTTTSGANTIQRPIIPGAGGTGVTGVGSTSDTPPGDTTLRGAGTADTGRNEADVPRTGVVGNGVANQRTPGAGAAVNQRQVVTPPQGSVASGGTNTAGGQAMVPKQENDRLAELMRRSEQTARRATRSICTGCLKDP